MYLNKENKKKKKESVPFLNPCGNLSNDFCLYELRLIAP